MSTATGNRRVGLMVIATGRYLDFARDLADDADHLLADRDVTLNLFTDRPDEARTLLRGLAHLQLNVLEIPELRWPEASLLRYEIFHRHRSSLVGDALVYLDADLRLAGSLDHALQQLEQELLLAVQHPGYHNRGPGGPRGTWETRRRSTAFVPRRKRRAYVCGGVWLGRRDAVIDMCEDLCERVTSDSLNGVTAVWHDESHWNWYVAHHGVKALSPAYCFVPDYPWLAGLEPVILAVDKGPGFSRELTDLSVRDEWRRQ